MMKVALIHDYLREYGGAERVLEALHELYPDAPVYVAFADPEAMGIHWQKFADWDIRESWMTRIPFYKSRNVFSPLRVIANQFFEAFDLSEYDVVISSTNMYFAKAVITKPWTVHICYCHTPPRPLYGYSTRTDWKKNPGIRIVGQLINHFTRPIDFLTSQRPDIMVANSQEVRGRIQKFYRRDAVVIYPPVALPFLPKNKTEKLKANPNESYYLYVGRITMSKHVDLAIQACVELGLRLKIVGTGAGEEYLESLANENVEFLNAVSDEKLSKLYANATALIFPSEDEDFGIVPVEAMGYGLPVIAYFSGGPKETIVDGKTGVFFDELTVESVKNAIQKSQTIKWNPKTIHAHAEQFSAERFKREIKQLVEKNLPVKKSR